MASLGGSSTTTAPAGQAAGGPAAAGAPGGGSGGGAGLRLQLGGGANALKFSACMRSHGVPGFPDPNGQGAIAISSSMGIDPNSPQFQAAQQACAKELPGGRPSPQQLAKAKQAMLSYSACMRAHGLPDFPDPTFSGGNIGLRLRGGPGSDLNPSSPTFQAAQKACQSDLPGKPLAVSAGAK